ncbi:DUF4011 domain-containing protein [Haloactinomyces albus]|uniref:Part of AAA domain-containing protein n=1 Tax=Haloactinomyces albus TaxID=1352928 RepID=A0AAE3ZIJ0_9ACTN|nr:DUF4011 domain-containing protein [Haloactinomyces albus]MDR7304234.1 hypothetical protein [Haloactinomyces albus]
MNDAPFAEAEHSDDRLRLALQYPPALNYALVHNRVPIVRRVVVDNLTGGELRDLDVTMELVGPNGRLAGPWQRRVTSIAAGSHVSWDTFADFEPDPAALAHTDEAFPAHYAVTVHSAGERSTELTAPCEVLAHNEWFNSPALYDSIAAFVQPSTTAVSRILRSAATLIEEKTGAGALEGYQSGPERASLIAGAIYEALRGESITYVGMPASFEDTGQKVRTTAGVLADRLGNCIDLSVTYAACLEAAGLHSLIVITEGHAFAGFFRQPSQLPETVSLEANHIVNLVESGTVAPVELTSTGPGTESMTFTQAVTAGLGQVRSPHRDLRGAIDIHLAHRSGIRPLPSGDRLPEEAQDEETVVLEPAAGPAIALPDEFVTTEASTGEDDGPRDPLPEAPPRIEQWRRRLLDLSLRNPLLKLPARGKGLDLHVPEGALASLDDLVHRHESITVLPQDRISGVHELAGIRRAQDLDDTVLADRLTADHAVYGHVSEEHYVRRMRALQRDARTMVQETGSNYLYLTLGALVHRDKSGEARAPLFLLPVRIEGGTGNKPYAIVIDGDELAAPNYSLIEWLRVKHSLRIPELESPATDDSGIDIPHTLAMISRRLVDNDLHHRVDSTASLRLLQFSTAQMQRDLTGNWRTMMDNPVVRHLVETPGSPFRDPQADGDVTVDESALHLPIPADGSQMKAVAMAEQGRSFVLEGPPGTGKSQTITNLIAHTIAAGRKVLFVAEKQAALDVVKRRLTDIGFDRFCLDLHGRKQSLPTIKQQLKDALRHEADSDTHTFTAAETAFRKRLETLRRHPQHVHERNVAGYSVWSAHEAVLALGHGPVADLPRSFLALPEQQRLAVEHVARELPTVLGSARTRPEHPWRISGLRSVDPAAAEAFRSAATELEQARAALHRLPEPLRTAVGELAGPGALAATLGAARLAAGGYPTDAANTEPTLRPGWDAGFDAAHQALRRFHDEHQHVLRVFAPDLFEHPELDTWQAEAEAAQRTMWRKKKKRRDVLERVRPHIADADEVTEDTVCDLLTAAKTARSAAGEVMQHVLELGGLRLAPGWRPTHPQALQALEAARGHAVTWRQVRLHHPNLATLYSRFAGQLPCAELELIAQSWRHWLGMLATRETEFARWRRGQDWTAAWDRDGAAWADELHASGLLPLDRWSAVLTRADTLEAAGLSAFVRQLLDGEILARDADEAFQRGQATTALDERLSHADLHFFDGAAHTHEVQEYLDAGARLRRITPEKLASDVLRNRPPVSTDTSSRDGELVRQLERKRSGLSFRDMLARYPDTITGLTPCFLMSPASVANFLDQDAVQFDLVVFDEASQIRVAEAVGAMGRARSVVVVGDSKQMPPTSMMETGHGDDDTGDDEADAVAEDMDSILTECVESGLPQVWLTWHYRSSDETLISFSNAYYYEGQLASLPSPGSGPHNGVSARRVAGVYDRGNRASRTNDIEATEIITEISRMLADPATQDRSIGVVTFNIQQRDLLLNLLESSDDPRIQTALAREDGEALFVKNLENVQGDERDVVLFSLAFSVDPGTGRLPLNFGPLTKVGGERRLNVAITRARSQVLLFSSFDPADIDLNRTNSVGLRHLRAYLDMAVNGTERIGELSAQRQRRDDQILTDIAAALRERGYEVATRYGLSHFTVDLAVCVPGSRRRQVAILLDGPEWAQRPTVADRDAAPRLLESIMGWPGVVRLWLPAWISDRAAVLEAIDEAMDRATASEEPEAAFDTGDLELGEPGSRDPDAGERASEESDAGGAKLSGTLTNPEPSEEWQQDSGAGSPAAGAVGEDFPDFPPEDGIESGDVGEVDDVTEVRDGPTPVRAAPAPPVEAPRAQEPQVEVLPDETAVPGPGDPFAAYEPGLIGSKEDLNDLDRDPRVRRLVRQLLEEVTNAEGPVEEWRLARLVLECFGFQRARSPRVEAVLQRLPVHLTRRESELGTYVWPEHLNPETWRGFRKSRQLPGDRSLEEICPEEIVNAMCHALSERRIISTDELYKTTLNLLGHKRKTGNIRSILESAERIGIESGRLSKAKYDRRARDE